MEFHFATLILSRAGGTESSNPEPTATNALYSQRRRRRLRVKRKRQS